MNGFARSTIVVGALITAISAMPVTRPAHAQDSGSATAAAGPPPDWARTKEQMRELTFAGENAKVIAMAEKIVAAYPRFAEGHARLGGAHESLAFTLVRTDRATAIRHVELAEKHLRHAFELGGGEYPEATIRALIDIYEDRLPHPEKWKATVLEALKRYPAEPAAHWYGLQLILKEGRTADLGAAFRAARTSLPSTAEPRLDYASFVVAVAEKDAQPEVRDSLLREAAAIVDDVLKKNASDRIVRRKAEGLRKDIAALRAK